MRNIFTILFAMTIAFWQIGCTKTSDNSNTNAGSPTATPANTTNNSNQNGSSANANVKKDEPVPTFTDADTALAEGNKYYDNNETEKAIDAFKQAVKLNPDLAEAYFKLGVIYALIEKEKQGEVEVKVNEPTPAKTPAKKGKEVVVQKDSEKAFAEAVKAYKKIIAKNPKDDAAIFNLGRSYNKINDDKEAEKNLRLAVKLKPEDSQYQTELGAILIKLAKYDEAVGVLKKALKIDETNSQAQDLMEKAEAGQKRINFGIPKDKPRVEKSGADTKTRPTEEKTGEKPEEKPNVPAPKEAPTKKP